MRGLLSISLRKSIIKDFSFIFYFRYFILEKEEYVKKTLFFKLYFYYDNKYDNKKEDDE